MIILLLMFIDDMINQPYSLQVVEILKNQTSWYRDSQAVGEIQKSLLVVCVMYPTAFFSSGV